MIITVLVISYRFYTG